MRIIHLKEVLKNKDPPRILLAAYDLRSSQFVAEAEWIVLLSSNQSVVSDRLITAIKHFVSKWQCAGVSNIAKHLFEQYLVPLPQEWKSFPVN